MPLAHLESRTLATSPASYPHSPTCRFTAKFSQLLPAARLSARYHQAQPHAAGIKLGHYRTFHVP